MSEMVKYEQGGLIRSMADAERAATAMARSGYFQDAKDAAQAVVKILAGQEMGFGPFASMTGVYVIQGRPAIGANLMAAAVKRSGRYDYRVTEMTDKRCAITFYQDGKAIGESEFTLEDARKAQTKNLDKYARNMLFARAISNGVRWYCPDVFAGAPAYTPEELGAEVDGEGNVIDAPVVQVVTESMVTQTGEPAPHWIDDADSRGKFWGWVKSLGLDNSDVHTALKVEHVHEYAGSKADARAAIEAYAKRNTQPEATGDLWDKEEVA
jgi:hypothetical protein